MTPLKKYISKHRPFMCLGRHWNRNYKIMNMYHQYYTGRKYIHPHLVRIHFKYRTENF